MPGFDEGQHPRDGHGEFAAGGGETRKAGVKKVAAGAAKKAAMAKVAEMTAAAHEASAKAARSGSAEDHAAAAKLHADAATTLRRMGNESSSGMHQAMAGYHGAEGGNNPAPARAAAPAPVHAAPAASPAAQPTPSGPHSDAQLASVVHQTIASMPEGEKEGLRGITGQKAFISDVYDRMPAADRARVGSLDNFKARVVQMSTNGHLAMSRADAQGDFPEAKVDRSETTHMGGRTHFINDRTDPVHRGR